MRSIVLLLVLLAIAVGVAFAIPLLAGEKDDPASIHKPEVKSAAKDPAANEPARIKTPTKVDVEEASTSEERRKWRLLRPAGEQLLPDPDGIGPCPPRRYGGHPARVTRQYINPTNGFHVWEHVDGAQTWIHWSPERTRPDGTRFRTRIITTVVPTDPMPISPEDNVKGR